MNDWLDGWLVGCLASWVASWVANWVANWVAGWFIDCETGEAETRGRGERVSETTGGSRLNKMNKTIYREHCS